MKWKIKKETMVNILGMVGSIGAVAATLLSSWVSDQRMKDEVREEIQKEFARRDEEENEGP